MTIPAGRRAAALLLVLCAAAAGCSRQEPRRAEAQVHRYTARGEVVRLPGPGSPGPEVAIRHEAIDDFADRTGQVVGMDAMVMPFAMGAGVPLSGIAVGDPVEFRFAVDWSRSAFWIERIDKLPPGTPLRFGPARKPPAAQK